MWIQHKWTILVFNQSHGGSYLQAPKWTFFPLQFSAFKKSGVQTTGCFNWASITIHPPTFTINNWAISKDSLFILLQEKDHNPSAGYSILWVSSLFAYFTFHRIALLCLTSFSSLQCSAFLCCSQKFHQNHQNRMERKPLKDNYMLFMMPRIVLTM